MSRGSKARRQRMARERQRVRVTDGWSDSLDPEAVAVERATDPAFAPAEVSRG